MRPKLLNLNRCWFSPTWIVQKDYSASPKIKEKHRDFSSVARDLGSIPSCSLLVKRLHAGLEMCVECFGYGLCPCVCSSASTCLALTGGPSLSTLCLAAAVVCRNKAS